MKRLMLIGLIIAAMVVPATMFAQVETSAGTLQIGGKVKWLYTFRAEDTDTDPDPGALVENFWGSDGSPQEDFATTSVEVDIMGAVGENVSYSIELVSANAIQNQQANQNELGTLGVRTAAIMISNVIPSTDVYVGTGMLPVGVYQPRATNDYDLIQLPLINTTRFGGYGGIAYAGDDLKEAVRVHFNAIVPGGVPDVEDLYGEYNPIGMGWQGTGFAFAIKPMDMIELDLCYGNGTLNGGANHEEDLEKSGVINLKIMPTDGAMISVAYIGEGWDEDNFGHQTASGYVVSGALANDKLEANFDWMQMTVEDYTFKDYPVVTADLDDREDLVYGGWQVTVGYWLTDAVEALLRYETVDPNMQNDEDAIPSSENDDITQITLGLNYLLSENAEVAINYVMIQENGDDIDAEDGDTPAADAKYQVIDNDTLLIQVQVWQ